MKKPEPSQGLVVRYDYLWRDEAQKGREEGAKERPCAIVVAQTGEGKEARVWLAPITHTAPKNPKAAIAIPPNVGKHLGLDDAKSWIITSELNSVSWADPGIVPATGSKWEYGFLPPKLGKTVTAQVLEQQRQKPRIVDRTKALLPRGGWSRSSDDERGR